MDEAPTADAANSALFERLGIAPSPVQGHEMLGAASNLSTWLQPLNGLRHPVTATTCGWYLWAGEHLSTAPDFFNPMHVRHLEELRPEAIPYLALPPGWRFLIAPGYEDVWFDESLLLV